MKELSLRNVTMMAAVGACFTQIGAQLYALSVVASTVSAAPPRSFAILVGDYRYDSSAFWDTAPPIVFALFIIALIANWKTQRRNLMLVALAIFIVGGLVMMLVVEPEWTDLKAIGFRDEVDPMLQSRAARWYALDWLGWAIGAIGGLTLFAGPDTPGHATNDGEFTDSSKDEEVKLANKGFNTLNVGRAALKVIRARNRSILRRAQNDMAAKQESQLLRTDGTLNIEPKGLSKWEQFDLHTSMVTMGWLSFFLAIISLFIAVNIIFTAIYISLSPDEIDGISREGFLGRAAETFFFSTQIITTLGYSRVVPVGMAASSVAAFESVLGVILFAFATGLSYARFARPRSKIIYSKNMVISPYEGAKALMVRTVNCKRIQLVNLSVEMVLTVSIRVEGKPKRFFYTLPLEQGTLGMMMMSWVIVHRITEDSPLYSLTADDLVESDAEILLMITGTDDILSQTVFSRTSFKPSQIIWGAEFLPITEIDERGNMEIDVSKMHETRKVIDDVT